MTVLGIALATIGIGLLTYRYDLETGLGVGFLFIAWQCFK